MEEARKIEEAYDEKLRIEREDEEEEDREKAREERVKARQVMKELRAERAEKRDLDSAYLKSKVKNLQSKLTFT